MATPLSGLNQTKLAVSQLNMTSYVAINSTEFPAISVTRWDYDLTPPLSSIEVQPRFAQLVFVINQ